MILIPTRCFAIGVKWKVTSGCNNFLLESVKTHEDNNSNFRQSSFAHKPKRRPRRGVWTTSSLAKHDTIKYSVQNDRILKWSLNICVVNVLIWKEKKLSTYLIHGKRQEHVKIGRR